jgi:hypothetical protein
MLSSVMPVTSKALERAPLSDLRAQFLATSTASMPIAGILFWSIVAIAGLVLRPQQLAYVVGFGSGMIFPLAVAIDRARGRTMTSGGDNPITAMFLQSLVMVVLLWPLVIVAAAVAREPLLIVLGGAILMGIVWIPYGWAADDPAGMQHALARAVLSYAAFLGAPAPYKATAVSIAVLVCYVHSLIRMKRASV